MWLAMSNSGSSSQCGRYRGLRDGRNRWLNVGYLSTMRSCTMAVNSSGSISRSNHISEETVWLFFSHSLYSQAASAGESLRSATQASLGLWTAPLPREHNAAMPGTLALVVAHPDDDAYGVAGTVALHADDPGFRYVLVHATDGEAGEIAPGFPATPETLGAIRREEDRRAWDALGRVPDRHEWLGYPDGHVAAADDLEERIAAIFAQERPDVVGTFGPDGITGHPDHIAVGAAADAAFHRFVGDGGPGVQAFDPRRDAGVGVPEVERLAGTARGTGLGSDGCIPAPRRAGRADRFDGGRRTRGRPDRGRAARASQPGPRDRGRRSPRRPVGEVGEPRALCGRLATWGVGAHRCLRGFGLVESPQLGPRSQPRAESAQFWA